MLGNPVALSVEASGLEEEEDVVNGVIVSTSSGLTAEEVSFSVTGMCVVCVKPVVLDSDKVLEVADIETAGPLKVEIKVEDDEIKVEDDMVVVGGVNGGIITGLTQSSR